jgi:hypothetical protein
MLELFTPYLFQDSYRRRTDQEHPSAKERSSVLKTLKTIGTMYISFPLKISKRRRTAANFLLNKDGGVFNTPNINESQQTGFKNARIDVPCHVMCFVWS